MKISRHYLNWSLMILLTIMSTSYFFAQNDSDSPLHKLDKLISEDKLSEAQTLLIQSIDDLISKERYYDVTDFVYYLGKIRFIQQGNKEAENAVLNFKNRLESITRDPKALRQLHLEVGSFYESLGNTDAAITNNLKALEYTKKMPDASGQLFGLIQSNLGVFYSRTGQLENAIAYHNLSTKSYLSDNTTPKEQFYMNYNSLGAMMWYQSKMDSALVFFRKAEKILKTMEQTPWNQFYRTASLQNNICGVYSIQGNQNAAIREMRKCVDNLKTFLKQDNVKDINRQYAREFLFQAMDNYARLYREVGDFSKAKEIITYAYRLKQKHLNKDSPEISKSKVLIGQIDLALHDYQSANTILDESIQEFQNNPSPYNNWLAMAYYYKGQANDYLGHSKVTMSCYEKSDCYFKKSLGEYYDEVYIDFIINASAFYAKHNKAEKAIQMANDAYNYIVENQGEKTLLEYLQVLNLADIEYELKNYKNALEKSRLALEILEDSVFIKTNDLGKLRIDALKPDAILTKTKAEYQLNMQKDHAFLTSKLVELEKAIRIIGKQKSILSNENTISILIQNNNEIFELAKRIALDLYEKTQSDEYLKKVLNLHESMLYNRIRNRLNSQSALVFADIPEKVVQKENELKTRLKSSFSENDALDSFLKTNSEWEEFLETLKTNYPKYYQLRYATISKSLDDIENKLPDNTTVVRYAFIDSNLYAYVIGKMTTKLFKLNSNNLKQRIALLLNDDVTQNYNFDILHELYNSLWEPISKSIETNNVIIIPDQILFNLNFEMLTPNKITSFKEMGEQSLLSLHTISYNYSLFLIEKRSKTVDYDRNFVAFAPEFSSKMKIDYKLAISDSLGIDQTYLTLLPQPFTKNLAKISSKLFDGTSFLNEKASKQIFTSSAKEHKIIHIGTHAESNNISPELSRLIFAKNVTNTTATNDNSLYTFEIYNQNLSSNLAILTACETGKPTYRSGEGMISLAHAFNYAGSESILTSLWKIDEKSSAEIIELFYNNISKGMSKDKALQNAKLEYIKTAEGRTKHPQYWAGLVLIGDTSPIDLQTSSNLVFWLFGMLFIIIIVVLLKRKHKA